MKAAVLYDVDDIRIEERAVPEIGPGELLVHTRASGICTGDIMGWYVRRKAPLVLGHEPAGVVSAVGDGVHDFAPGDRVFVHHHAPCFACRACERGDYVQCATWRKTSIDPGGLAEYFRVPRENVRDTLRLPQSIPFVDGSLVEPLACVVKSVRRSGLRAGDSVHIIGLGVMGLMHALTAQAIGAAVSGSDFLEPRRAHASSLGVRALRPDESVDSADVVICGPGSPEALRDAFAAVAPGGTVVMFTPLEPGVPFTFDPNDLYFRDVKLVTSYSCGPNDTREALDLIARGIVTAERLGATLYPLEEASAAYEALRGSRIIKPIVTFEPTLFP
ncbi:MAG TPA: alcohol dehydrogenase catalytic domain-containing protein [Candidatus Baltobacteraceae bacterium]|nr:alcohol dehydrogenase catalytic domain-containing protein [Candidatus Baltobacteraceae bacterium]